MPIKDIPINLGLSNAMDHLEFCNKGFVTPNNFSYFRLAHRCGHFNHNVSVSKLRELLFDWWKFSFWGNSMFCLEKRDKLEGTSKHIGNFSLRHSQRFISKPFFISEFFKFWFNFYRVAYSKPSKSIPYSCSAATNFLRNVCFIPTKFFKFCLKPKFIFKLFNTFFVFAFMKSGMIRLRYNHKIIDAVISWVSIFMMDLFMRFKVPSNVFLNYKTMLMNIAIFSCVWMFMGFSHYVVPIFFVTTFPSVVIFKPCVIPISFHKSPQLWFVRHTYILSNIKQGFYCAY